MPPAIPLIISEAALIDAVFAFCWFAIAFVESWNACWNADGIICAGVETVGAFAPPVRIAASCAATCVG